MDNLSGVLIIYCVLFYHLAAFIDIEALSFRLGLRSIFGFFIAWFFFKSGINYKQRTVEDELQKCWRRLLIPFIVINAICILIRCFVSKDASILEILKVDFYRESDVMCNPLWFCLSLSIVRIVYQLFSNTRFKHFFIYFSFLIAFLLYLYSYQPEGIERIISIPPWVGNLFLGYFFYGMGDFLRDYQFNKYLTIASTIVYLVCLFFPCSLDFYKNYSENNYLLSTVYDLSAIIAFNSLFKRFIDIRIPLLTHIGRNSMIYYITHYTFFYIFFTDNNHLANSWVIAFIITVIFLFVSDILFTRTRLRWLIGG